MSTTNPILLRAYLTVTLPSLLLFIATVFGTLLLALTAMDDSPWLLVAGVGGLALGIALLWAYWSFAIVKWRVWAFAKTPRAQWRELHLRAIQAQLIWPRGHRFERTEWRNARERAFLQSVDDFLAAPPTWVTEPPPLSAVVDDPSIQIGRAHV